MDPMAKGARATGARKCNNSDAYGTRGMNQRRFLKSCLPMGTMAANWKSEDFGTSPFFEQLFRQVSACLYMPINGRAVDKEQ